MGAACDHDHVHGGLHGGALERALAVSERRIVDAGERVTAPRRRVLTLLLEAGEPVKAYDLIARFGGAEGQAAKPPTVYRALDFLERLGLAHRIASISAYVACSGDDQSAHAAAFLICDCCGATREVAIGEDDRLHQAAQEAGYAVQRTTIEAHGRCAACREAA